MKNYMFLLLSLLFVILSGCKITEEFAYSEYTPQSQYRIYDRSQMHWHSLKPIKIQDRYRLSEMKFNKNKAKTKKETKSDTKSQKSAK